jgi:hypothetical protein
MVKVIGSRAQVWHSTATHTSGGLQKSDLMQNKRGRIVSKKRHQLGQSAIKHLEKSGHKGILPNQRKKKGSGMLEDMQKLAAEKAADEKADEKAKLMKPDDFKQ